MTDLVQARKDLLTIIDQQIQRKYILAKKTFYEHGNKVSKLLAKAIQTKKSDMTIHSVVDPSGKKINQTPDIAKQFVKFYTKLYNLPQSDPPNDDTSRKQMIIQFLEQYGPTKISESTAQDLASPLTTDEVNWALTQIQVKALALMVYQPGTTNHTRKYSFRLF